MVQVLLPLSQLHNGEIEVHTGIERLLVSRSDAARCDHLPRRRIVFHRSSGYTIASYIMGPFLQRLSGLLEHVMGPVTSHSGAHDSQKGGCTVRT